MYYHFRRFRLKGIWYRLFTALRTAERERAGRNADPSAAIIDSQSVKTVEESASISGFNTHKHVKGRKRHLLVDTLGLPLSIYVTPADVHDTLGARRLLAGLAPLVPRLKKIWADGAYRGQTFICRSFVAAGERRLEACHVERGRPTKKAAQVLLDTAFWLVDRSLNNSRMITTVL